MFLLNKLPLREELLLIQKKFPHLNPDSVITLSHFLKSGSGLLLTLEQFLKKQSFTQGRFLILMILYRAPDLPRTPAAIASMMGIKRPTATGMIDKLLKSGLIQKLKTQKDQRSYLIQITPPGIEQLEQVLPRYFDLINKITTNLTTQEQQQLLQLINKLNTTPEA